MCECEERIKEMYQEVEDGFLRVLRFLDDFYVSS